ncbi:hypothetical protein HETIRDRAFT_106382 [Heterobasidion irregulare TC 32-1]|uniref:SET domain-containing protein n=1 Tax=Heterobasidion irregulare (strain TC 32-1) TaxID=747525 RepID=W4JQF0_HETIT|nr:uncharacterized protein HETIRDRAFT_106382 [Heterobasidion irregulare TC 32-1]ETW75709.1 hypothetical protein HETIRDRAFT_106382 [Heterobasidion irregulare TC 32-1]
MSTDDDDFLTVETYSEDGKISKTTHVPVQTASISSLPELKPYSAYEGCTPISRNIFLGDDSDHLPFIPFADDPGFDWAENAEFFTYLAWESRFFDPDQDLIILEAASRLQRAWSITPEQMDKMTVFPRSLLSQPEQAVQRSLEVRESDHGLGLFTTEPVKEDEFVLEYVGEIIYGSTIDSRDALARHRTRNYVFGLDTTFAIDATSAGNISRYINHADDANCYSRLLQVNDENRIGIFAIRDIEPGEEISINYGTQFFQADEAVP